MHSIPAFPGLLRRCSPVVMDHGNPGALAGVVLGAQDFRARVAFWDNRTPDLIPVPRLSLDLSDPTGRLHARMWLGEQGQPTTEDRAEVLAWSVESARRGGGRVEGDASAWVADGRNRWYRYRDGYGRTYATGKAQKEAVDARFLLFRWALTNDDGSLTLPPLPEVTHVAR